MFLLYLNQFQIPDLAAVLSYNGYCDILLYHTRNNTVTKTEPYSIAIERRSSKLRPKQLKQKLSFVTHSMLLLWHNILRSMCVLRWQSVGTVSRRSTLMCNLNWRGLLFFPGRRESNLCFNVLRSKQVTCAVCEPLAGRTIFCWLAIGCSVFSGWWCVILIRGAY